MAAPQSHHKSKQHGHHPHPPNVGQSNKNPGSGGNSVQGAMKKNIRAWGNINPNSNPNSGVAHNPSTGSAWRMSSQLGGGSHPPSQSFANGAPTNQPTPGTPPHFSSHQPLPNPNDDKLVLKAMHDRMVWFIMSLVGVTVVATTKSGQRFQGLLSSAVTEAELCITLKRAFELPVASTSTLTTANGAQARNPPIIKSTLIILAKELVEVVATDVDLTHISSIGAGTVTNVGNGFKTDAETLGYRTDVNGQPIIREKELQTWSPNAGDLGTASSGNPSATGGSGLSEKELMNGLEDTLFPKASEHGTNRRFDKPWDQFEVNEKLFGTRTNYDEEIYTTKLDRTGKDFKEREKKAELIAREIMASGSSNPHIQEERGMLVSDDSGMNEEDKYGAVVRSEGAYVPPGARKGGAASSRGAIQPPTSSAGNKQAPLARQPAAPASNMARHLKSINEADSKSTSTVASVASSGQAIHPPAKAPPPSASNSLPAANPTPAPGSLDSRTNPAGIQPVPSTQPASTSSGDKSTNVVPLPQKSNIPPQPKLPKQPDEVTPRFKAFVSDEKERLQQKKKDLLRKEKESRLADLRAFSLAFKLPMAFPKDLEPIVKKSSNPPAGSGAHDSAASKEIETGKQLQQASDEAGRRASEIPGNTPENHTRHLSKVYNPSNLQASANQTSNNSLAKPALTPSVAFGLKKLGPLAPIPPFRPSNQNSNKATLGSGQPPQAGGGSNEATSKATRFVNIPSIPPFKPKNPSADANSSMVAKDLKLSSKAAMAFNPGAKTFNPPGGGTVAPSRKGGQASDSVSTPPLNPFFGHKPVKKGSSSMHVKEEFTPFKSGSVPEASSVGPAWNFTGKSYRQLFGASLPPHHHAHFLPHMMHPMSNQPQPYMNHPGPHHQQHPQAHNGGGHGYHQGHHPQNMMNNMMMPPMHMQRPPQSHPHHAHHAPNTVPQMIPEDDGMSGPMNNGGVVVGPNGVVMGGPNIMVGAGGVPVPSSHGYITNNGPNMTQQQQQQQQPPPTHHPHHLPPPIPPYMYHPQQTQPPPQSSQPAYNSNNNSSYHHGGGAGGPNPGGYGPPVPVMPGPGGSYPAGPPMGPGGNPGGPYMPHMGGYGGSPILGPGPHQNGGNGNGGNNGVHPYSPQMGGGVGGHGPSIPPSGLSGIYGPSNIYQATVMT